MASQGPGKDFDNLEGEYESSSNKVGAIVWGAIAVLIAGLLIALVTKAFTGDREAVAKKMRLKQAVSKFAADPTNPAYAKEAVAAWEASGDRAQAEKIQKRHEAAVVEKETKLEKDLRDRLAANGKDAEALGLLLEFLVQKTRTEDARKLYAAALASDPLPKKRAAYGTWLWRNKFTSEGVEELERALKEGYDTPETHGYLGFALIDQNKKREAFPHLQKAFKGNADIGPLRERYVALAKELGIALE